MKDVFGKNADVVKNKKLWLLDMDGTIYEEELLFEGTIELLNQIKKNKGQFVFITNNSSKSVADYIEKVNRLGICADTDNFFTSSQATVLYLKSNYPKAKVYCQGTRSLIRELKDADINVVEQHEPVDVVLIGYDTELNYDKIRNTCEILSTQDVEYIATNPDLVCPTSFGFVPDCGTICGMIKNATGKWPIFIGKPEPTMIEIVMNNYCMNKEETIVIGDRLYTDIAAGLSAGVTTICVLTGEATIEEINSNSVTPTLTFSSIKDVYKVMTLE